MPRQGMALRSILHQEARVQVCYRHHDVEVMVVEVDAGASLFESTLWGSSSFHLVVEGEALFDQDGVQNEVLPDGTLQLESGRPYTIANRSNGRLKMLSVVVANGMRTDDDAGS